MKMESNQPLQTTRFRCAEPRVETAKVLNGARLKARQELGVVPKRVDRKACQIVELREAPTVHPSRTEARDPNDDPSRAFLNQIKCFNALHETT